jgi:Tfp pilus assembly protein PilV
MKTRRKVKTVGTSLPEVLCAGVLLAAFFGSIFELNAVSFRYIQATKDAVAALEAVSDRTETLRNLAFSDLSSSTYLQTLLASPANASDFVKNATETVSVRAYPTANGVTQFRRTGSGAVTKISDATSLGNTLVQVDVSVSWTSVFGGRTRAEQMTGIISNGTKK